jgi:regulator of sigma E protease
VGRDQPDDRIVRINETPIVTWSQMTGIVQKSAGIALEMHIERNGTPLTVSIIPEAQKATSSEGETLSIGRIGIQISGRGTILRSPAWYLAPWDGLKATWDWCELTVVGIGKLVTGEISSKHIGGPLMIASVSGEHAEQGIGAIMWLIAILSINLGILNLLPIPVLDGGHLFFFACEAILGRPLRERSREIAQQAGILVLFCLMGYAFWNDINRLLQKISPPHLKFNTVHDSWKPCSLALLNKDTHATFTIVHSHHETGSRRS